MPSVPIVNSGPQFPPQHSVNVSIRKAVSSLTRAELFDMASSCKHTLGAQDFALLVSCCLVDSVLTA